MASINQPNFALPSMSVTRPPNKFENFESLGRGTYAMAGSVAALQQAKAKQDEVDLQKEYVVGTLADIDKNGLFPGVDRKSLIRDIVKGTLSGVDIANELQKKKNLNIITGGGEAPEATPAPEAPAEQPAPQEEASPVPSIIPTKSLASPVATPTPSSTPRSKELSDEEIATLSGGDPAKYFQYKKEVQSIKEGARKESQAGREDKKAELLLSREDLALKADELKLKRDEATDENLRKKLDLEVKAAEKQLTIKDQEIAKNEKEINAFDKKKTGKDFAYKWNDNNLTPQQDKRFNDWAAANPAEAAAIVDEYKKTGSDANLTRRLIEKGILQPIAPSAPIPQQDTSGVNLLQGWIDSTFGAKSKVEERSKTGLQRFRR